MLQNGTDVEGEINGGSVFGHGQVLTGAPGAENAEGLQLCYSGEQAPAGDFVGTVTVSQNLWHFQIGANDGQMTSISLRSTHSWDLGKGVSNESGFQSLKDIDVLQVDKATDSIRVIDKAGGDQLLPGPDGSLPSEQLGEQSQLPAYGPRERDRIGIGDPGRRHGR